MQTFTLDAPMDGDLVMTTEQPTPEQMARAVRMGAYLEKVRGPDGRVTAVRIVWPA